METNKTPRKIKKYTAGHRQKKKWLTVITCLACVVVFSTVYALILPAVTLENTVYCGREEHMHSEECYEKVLSCGLEESGSHVHSEECYDENNVLICGAKEAKGHTHSEDCYASVLTCDLEEHTHTQACYSAPETAEPEEEPESVEDGIMAQDAGDDTSADVIYKSVKGFYLWLHLRDVVGNVKNIYSNPEWVGNKFDSDGISDALTYTDAEGEVYYLIPVLYFIDNYKKYGYSFDENSTDACPFLYAPDAEASTKNLTAASYVYVENKVVEGKETSGWYVRVQDTGEYNENASPRSNIYYTYYKTQEVSAFRLWMHAKGKGASGYIQVVGYDSQNSNTKGDLNDVLQVKDVNEGDTNYYLIPVSYFSDNYKDYDYSFNENSTDVCPFFYAPDANNSIANLTAASYVYLADKVVEGNETSGWYVQVQDTGNYDNPPRSNVYYSAPATVVEDAVSPSGTVINLFDYWVRDTKEDDVEQSKLSPEYYTWGINNGHALKFKPIGLSGANLWTGSSDVYQGIVANKLSNGYPVLSGRAIFGNEDDKLVSSNESLAYLFDPIAQNGYRNVYRNVTGLLQVNSGGYYYYDSTKNYAEYDEDNNRFTLYDQSAITYTDMNNQTTNGQFFPFDAFGKVSAWSADNPELNHYFGMTLTARFIQQYGGYTDATKRTAMSFEFSGDDDVWIFIDGVLVADLGGIHNEAKVRIDFSTGKVIINEGEGTDLESESTIKDAFVAAGEDVSDPDMWSEDTFADDTYHTLKFFYLERGSFASNLKLTYNLKSYPPTAIYKVNQYNDPVAGAAFSVYAAKRSDNGEYTILNDKGGSEVTLPEHYAFDDGGNIVSVDGNDADKILAKALYTGITDDDGGMVFLDEDKVPYSLTDLKNMFGDCFVLMETKVPDGYRLVNDVINLRIYNNKVLLCDNTYTSGVYSAPSLQVTAPSILWPVNAKDENGAITYVEESDNGNIRTNGSLFAVVLKYIGPKAGNASEDDLKEQANWAPVYGTDEEGFRITDVADYREQVGNDENKAFVAAVIDTARKYKESKNEFEMSAADGQMQAQIKGMPGDITTYYYMLDDANKNKAQYTVAYYYTTADSLKEANVANTVRINADAEGYALTRSFGATINVPNLLNHLIAQKLDEAGNLVNGATFALYSVEQKDNDNTIYYVGTKDGENNKTLICLYPDDGEAGNNKGKAYIKGNAGVTGTYEIVDEASEGRAVGDIVVTMGKGTNEEAVYIIKAVNTAVTLPKDDDANKVGEDGTASFTNMEDGYYYLREIAAPAGFKLNTAEIMVLVDDTAVYANAGTADDGVTVARGPGYVVATLEQFASQGQIDNTLTWVYEQMLVSGESGRFSDVYTALNGSGGDGNAGDGNAGTPQWKYLKSYSGSGYAAMTETTEAENEALTTHLAYDISQGANTLFNYTVNNAWYEENGYDEEEISAVTRRLYTSVGWSYYRLYQDYGYVYDEKGNLNTDSDRNTVLTEGANYTDLRKYGDISNLFSRSTFVQVTDKKYGDLEIGKRVENDTATAENPDSFEFSVSLYTVTSTTVTETDGSKKEMLGEEPLTGSYDYTVYNVTYDDETGKEISRTPAVDENGNAISGAISYSYNDEDKTTTCSGVIRLKDKQVAVISDLPYNAHYTVTETAVKNYTTTVSQNGEEPQGSITASGELVFNAAGDEENITTVAYTNTYVPPIDIKIQKVDSADTNKALPGAKFVLYYNEDDICYYYHPDDEKFRELASEGGTTETEEDVAVTTRDSTNSTERGTFTFRGIVDGTYYLKEIKAPDGYNMLTAEIVITVDGGAVKSALAGTTSYIVKKSESENTVTITVPNSSGYMLPNTGGNGTYLYIISGLLIMACAVGYGYRLRRRRERRGIS